MSFNWITKYFSKHEILKNIPDFGLKKHLGKPCLWSMQCETVARGVAVGLFTAMVPILPFQTLLAIGLCILISANIPIAFLVSFVSNPFTILPLAYFTSYVGQLLIGAKSQIVLQKVSLKFSSFHAFWQSFSSWIFQFGKGFFIGLPFVAISAGIFGYILVRVVGLLMRKK